MNTGSVPIVTAGDTLLNTKDAPALPGTQAWTRDGRRFRLVKNGPSLLATGSLIQGPVTNLAHLNMTPTADVAIGSRTVRVTSGGGAGANVPANTYAGGLMIVAVGPGGLSFAVKSHEAIVAAQPFTIVLESDDPVWFGLTAATSKIDLIANPYTGVIATPGTAAVSGPVGLAVATIDVGNWGFVQVEGLATAIADGAIGIGQAVSPSITIAGAMGLNATTLPVIGSAVKAGLANQGFAVSLNLP